MRIAALKNLLVVDSFKINYNGKILEKLFKEQNGKVLNKVLNVLKLIVFCIASTEKNLNFRYIVQLKLMDSYLPGYNLAIHQVSILLAVIIRQYR